MQTESVHAEAEREAQRYRRIESEKAGFDLGEAAVRRWVRLHWSGFLRARWVEHVRGERFWVELDRGDFGLLRRRFQGVALLLDRILDRLAAGRDNLDVLNWAIEWGIPTDRVIEVLEALDGNSRRLANGPGGPACADAPLVTLDPAWLAWEGGVVPRLARGIAEDGAFDRLPVLGDALEEAGCADPAILDHCRSAGRDVRQSWLVDLLLWGA